MQSPKSLASVTSIKQSDPLPLRMTPSFFNSIPPERVGPNGNYDHSGLAKRVFAAFEAECGLNDLEGLRVTQRGKVVLLMGSLPSQKLLERLISVALGQPGAIDVETIGMRVL